MRPDMVVLPLPLIDDSLREIYRTKQPGMCIEDLIRR